MVGIAALELGYDAYFLRGAIPPYAVYRSRLLTPFHVFADRSVSRNRSPTSPLSESHRQLVRILTLVEVESLVLPSTRGVGRPARHRRPSRGLCGQGCLQPGHHEAVAGPVAGRRPSAALVRLESAAELPHESQFSRALPSLRPATAAADARGADRSHAERATHRPHFARLDRDRSARKTAPAAVEIKPVAADKRKPGRPKKEKLCPRPSEANRPPARDDTGTDARELPRLCNAGAKRNSKGYTKS